MISLESRPLKNTCPDWMILFCYFLMLLDGEGNLYTYTRFSCHKSGNGHLSQLLRNQCGDLTNSHGLIILMDGQSLLDFEIHKSMWWVFYTWDWSLWQFCVFEQMISTIWIGDMSFAKKCDYVSEPYENMYHKSPNVADILDIQNLPLYIRLLFGLVW